jgi:copper(I)-binding protein
MNAVEHNEQRTIKKCVWFLNRNTLELIMKKIIFACALTLAASTAMAKVTVSEPWIRATVAQQPTAGAYMQLHSSANARLVSVQSPLGAKVEVHEMSMQDNIMRMRQVDGLALPAGKTVELKPGAYHLMMTGLKHELKAGDHVPMTLTIEQDGKRETLSLDVPVRALTGKAMQQSAHEHMHSSEHGSMDMGTMKMDMSAHH